MPPQLQIVPSAIAATISGAGWLLLRHRPRQRPEAVAAPRANDADADADSDSDSDGESMAAPGQQLQDAAAFGDASKVERLLLRHNLLADALHPDTGSTLLMYVAAVTTDNAARDKRLAEVMAVLSRHGANLQQRQFPQNESAIHLLVAQPQPAQVYHRAEFLVKQLQLHPRPVDMVQMPNAAGLLPAQVAAKSKQLGVGMMLMAHHAFIAGYMSNGLCSRCQASTTA